MARPQPGVPGLPAGLGPVPLPYDNVTLDLSHTSTAGSDALQMATELGSRLAHVHLADGTGAKDEHLVPVVEPSHVPSSSKP